MALRKRLSQNQYRQLTDKEIKKEIMLILGLNPNDREDNRKYKRIYDVYRLRVKNYLNQQNLSSIDIRANESLLRTLRRQINNIELTAEQKNILSTPARNTTSYKNLIQSKKIEDIRIKNIENLFYNFIHSGSREVLYYDKFYNKIYFDENGEVAKNITSNFIYELKDNSTYNDIKQWLYSEVDALHEWQKKTFQAYGGRKTRKQIGSP